MDANTHRGEVDLTWNGKTRVMRPTFAAIEDIERRTGQGVVELLQDAATGKLRMSHAAIILAAGIKAAMDKGPYPTPEKIGEGFVQHTPYMSCLEAIGEFLTNALTGGAAPKLEAATEDTTPAAAADTHSENF
jgi:Phage tail tube protein, GTA-gp10